MKIEDVKTPEELLKFMDEHIQYGFTDGDGNIYTMEDDEAFEEGVKTVWRLGTAHDLIKGGYGHCWDQVEFEREWFLNHGYVVKTIYIWFELDHENPYTTHTSLIYEEDDKYCLFEHADYMNRGISKFDTYKDALFRQIENHLKTNRSVGPMTKDVVECLHIYEYDRPPYGIDMFGFIDFIMDEGTKIL